MSVGVNQLMLAMSYYLLGYAMLQVQAPVAAIAGVIILTGSAEVIARIDLTLPVWDQRLIQALLVFGPTVACLASYHYVQQQDMTTKIAECLAPVAFISHGIVIALMTLVLSVREQENGAMLPLAFQGVLYLDVFGWVSHKRARDSGDPEKLPLREPSTWKLVGPGPGDDAELATAEPPSRTTSARRGTLGTPAGPSAVAAAGPGPPLGYFAKEYTKPPADGLCVPDADTAGASDEEEEAEGHRVARPAASAVRYDAAGRPLPSRPLGAAPAAATEDMRLVEGAPRAWDHVNAVEPPAKGFWDPVTFMPQGNRRREKMDSLISEAQEQSLEGQERASFWGFKASREEEEDEGVPMATGHDNEMPGVLPWQVFRNASFVISLTWILAGVYYILHVTGVWTMALPWNEASKDAPAEAAGSRRWGGGSEVVPRPGVFSLLAAGVTLGEVGPEVERIEAHWPYADIQPLTLACDATGRRLLATDGLSIFEATLPAPAPAAARAAGRPAPRRAREPAWPSARFRQAPGCPALQGEALQDVALHCGAGGGCEALALHHDGTRLAACPLAAAAAGGYVGQISQGWLQRPVQGAHGRTTWRREQARWLLVDQACAAAANRSAADELQRGGCVSVATTHGSVAQLARRASGRELAPTSVVEVHGTEALTHGGHPRVQRPLLRDPALAAPQHPRAGRGQRRRGRGAAPAAARGPRRRGLLRGRRARVPARRRPQSGPLAVPAAPGPALRSPQGSFPSPLGNRRGRTGGARTGQRLPGSRPCPSRREGASWPRVAWRAPGQAAPCTARLRTARKVSCPPCGSSSRSFVASSPRARPAGLTSGPSWSRAGRCTSRRRCRCPGSRRRWRTFGASCPAPTRATHRRQRTCVGTWRPSRRRRSCRRSRTTRLPGCTSSSCRAPATWGGASRRSPLGCWPWSRSCAARRTSATVPW
ncbi:unnamed protein product, partial [Prorocentrum cordatum]